MDFIPQGSTLVGFFFASVLLAATPGPDMTLMLSRTLSYGRSAGFCTLLGTVFGCFIHICAAVIGLSALLAASPFGFTVLKITGALYLLYLAFRALTNKDDLSFENKEGKSNSLLKNFMLGAGVNILNPKVIIFFITFLPQFTSPEDPFAWQKLLFLGLFFNVTASMISLCILFMAGKFAHALKSNPKINKAINYVFGTVFAVFAIKILLTEGQ